MAETTIEMEKISFSTSTDDDFTKAPSIYPAAPLDAVVKQAFPGRTSAFSDYGVGRPAPVWTYWIWTTFLVFLAIFGCVFPLVIFYRDPGSPLWFDIGLSIVSAGPIALSLPIWLIFYFFRPSPPVVPTPPVNEDTAVAVDILVTTYKESLDELAGTLAAIQNLVWHGPVNVYILDDANRSDIERLCAGMKKCKYGITHVTRDGNAGKKAGNINNFMKVMPRTADFFIILDVDMRPFPNMLQLLFGAYFDVKLEKERARIGFITSPQFFRNYTPKTDHYDMVCSSWVNTVLPCMDTIDTVPFIGTNALWKRDALERCGGFLTQYATEDVSTGCKVHCTVNENGDKYISKYMPVPVAAGVTPRTLAELMDQHTRWNTGQAQMTFHYNFFFFCKELRSVQRFFYFCTMASWIRHIPSFLILWFGTIFFNIASAFIFKPNEAWNPPVLTIIATLCSIILPTSSWLLLPGSSLRSKLRGIQMSMVYITTEITAAAVVCFGVKVPVKFASDVVSSNWHPHFGFHISVYLSIVASALFCIIRSITLGITNAVPYVQSIFLVSLWTFAFFPVYRAINGHEDHEDKKWMSLEVGRVNLFSEPVWAEMDNITFEQLKDTVVRLYQRVEQQDSELKRLCLDRTHLQHLPLVYN